MWFTFKVYWDGLIDHISKTKNRKFVGVSFFSKYNANKEDHHMRQTVPEHSTPPPPWLGGETSGGNTGMETSRGETPWHWPYHLGSPAATLRTFAWSNCTKEFNVLSVSEKGGFNLPWAYYALNIVVLVNTERSNTHVYNALWIIQGCPEQRVQSEMSR